MRRLLAGAIAILAWVQSTPAGAYTVQTGFTDGCHERITAEAFARFVDDTAWGEVVVPNGDTWRKLAQPLEAWLVDQSLIEEELTEPQLFVLFSLIVGVRAPDNDGRSASDLNAQRNIHASPVPEAQYVHALRAPGDEEPDGSEAAVTGTRESTRGSLSQALAALEQPSDAQVFAAPVTIDFYNLFEVQVWQPGFLLGKAMHTLQDSFSHSIRDEERGLREIAHVLNYVDAIYFGFDESRDGIAHSRHLDRCDAAGLEALRAASISATGDVLTAFVEASAGDASAIDAVIDEWLTLRNGCSSENDFCDNKAMLNAARQDPTDPIFPEWTTCSAAAGPTAGRWASLVGLSILLVLAGRMRRRG